MAKYTIELGTLVSSGYCIFDESWDTFIPEHKKELCDKIVRKYWFNEIGAETPDRFKHYLNEQLARQMPTFNKLYESELWSLYPLYNHIMESQGESSATSNEIANTYSRRDLAAIKQMGDSLYRELKSDKWGTSDTTAHEVTGEAGNLTGDHTEKEIIDKLGTRDYTKKQDNILTEESQRDINTVEHSEEVMDDDTTEHRSDSENKTTTRRYSDTPQGEVTVAGGLSIDAQYLTNYETINENRSLTSDAKGTDDRTTTFDKTVKTDDDLNRTVKEDNTETLDEDTTENTNRNKTNHDVEDTTHWRDVNSTTNQVTHETTHDKGDEFKESVTQDNGTNVEGSSSGKQGEELQTTSNKQQGTVGVSRVELLNKYRQSIINVDEIIITSLAENFMGVF